MCGGSCEKNEGGVCRRGVKKTKCGKRGSRKKIEGSMPETGREDKIGGGGCEKKIERSIPERGKEDNMRRGV